MTAKRAERNGGGAGQQQLYRMLPQLGELLEAPAMRALTRLYPRELVASAARSILLEVREEIANDRHSGPSLEQRVEALPAVAQARLSGSLRPSLRPVINATGVVLHTNLGRAPLGPAALAQVVAVAEGYCNLELDLETGERGRRDEHIEALLLRLLALRTGQSESELAATRAATVVNNCAAATLLALNTLAEGGEVIVSRGELLEIGGGFRIPDILRKSGAALREVGATNRTRLADYAAAITPQTRLILRVHPSNFRMEGFTGRPPLEELIALSERSSVPLFEDQGTGCVVPLESFAIVNEASLVESCRSGPTLIAASGDKLFGGPQCGLLVGRKDAIAAIRGNPMMRALRVDKMSYAALQATLLEYLQGRLDRIPTLRTLQIEAQEIQHRCEVLASALAGGELAAEVIPTRSLVGGGTTPGVSLASFAVALRPTTQGANALAAALRSLDPPVLARVHEDRVLLDLRTVPAATDATLLRLLQSLSGAPLASRTGVSR